MKRNCPFVLTVLLAVTTVKPANAQEARDSVDRYAFDLDTQSGHYSFWSLQTLRHDRLRVTLVVGELRRDARWAPAFMLSLRAGDDIAFLRLWAPARKSPLVMTLEARSGQDADSVQFTRTVAVDETIHVELDWSKRGVLRAVIDSREVRDIRLAFRPISFEVTSSTGQIKADSLVLFRRP